MRMFERMFNLGLGAVSLTYEKAEKVFDEMVERGELSREEARKDLDELMKRGDEEQKEFRSMIHDEVDKWRSEFGAVSRNDLEELKARIEALEEKLK